MKLFILISLILIFSSCTHQHGKASHHHHANDEAISPDEHGKGKYIVEDRGETFYFDSEKEFLEFGEQVKNRKMRPKCVRKGRTLSCGE